MAEMVKEQLIKYLTHAHALEKQALLLLARGADIVGDEEIARIYRAHRLQTQELERYVSERLQALGHGPSKLKDIAGQAAALGIGVAVQALPDTPIRLATTAFAFENHEIATYRVIERLAERAGDTDTVSVAKRMLEQEEASEHQGPQEYKDTPPGEPVAQPPDIESPTEEERKEELASPPAGYPTEDVNPPGGETPSPTHPETLGDTTPDQQSS